MRPKMLAPVGFVLSLVLAAAAEAIPTLQLYIDGATYDAATETWIISDSTFDLWVIGNVAGPGGTGIIENVALSAAFFTAELGSISLTETTTSTVTDPSTPDDPIFAGTSADGARPQLNDGTFLPTHGVYGTGVSFLEWELGDMTLRDSPTGDFITTFPGVLFPGTGQINVYSVTVTGFSAVHFDVYNSVVGEIHSSFAPFSHDVGAIPEPGSVAVLSIGLLVAGGLIARLNKD